MKKDKLMKKMHIAGSVILLILLACIGLFTFAFFNSIRAYSEFDVDYSDLSYQELTFVRYQKIRLRRADYRYVNYRYVIYVEEYEKPLEISNISDRRLDKEKLENLHRNQTLQVYLRPSNLRDYDYEICEFACGSDMLLSLSDYVATNQSNQRVGMILCPCMIAMCIFLGVVMIVVIKIITVESDYITVMTVARDEKKVGKVRMQYVVDGNVIQVCKYIGMCSLVVNGKVVDRHTGIGEHKYLLFDEWTVDGKKYLVEAQMGYVNMRLYCNGKLVAKKFMGFG